MFVARRHSDDPAVIAFQPSARLSNRIARRLRRGWIVHSLGRYQRSRSVDQSAFSDDRVAYKKAVTDQLPLYDVINLHWIARFVDYRSFFTHVSRTTQIVWTLHDMNPFTGGCHYTHGCEKYVDQCGACPQLSSKGKNDLSYQIWQRKRKALQAVGTEQLHIAVPSRWLAIEVGRSSLMSRFSVTHIPNGVDTEIFSPQDRRLARETLDIPQDARVILFVARFLHKTHKGLVLLAQALSTLRDLPGLLLVSLGQGRPTIPVQVPHVHLGHLENDGKLALAYSAADLLVIPSLQDNLPNTALEAMSCGVPIVGFEVGGIPDVVRPGVTGLLATPGDVVALGDAVARLLQDPMKRAAMGANCRYTALEEYTLEVQAHRYAALYKRAGRL
jgi:glycosyltransferase involved in cell wall biosynthesis